MFSSYSLAPFSQFLAGLVYFSDTFTCQQQYCIAAPQITLYSINISLLVLVSLFFQHPTFFSQQLGQSKLVAKQEQHTISPGIVQQHLFYFIELFYCYNASFSGLQLVAQMAQCTTELRLRVLFHYTSIAVFFTLFYIVLYISYWEQPTVAPCQVKCPTFGNDMQVTQQMSKLSRNLSYVNLFKLPVVIFGTFGSRRLGLCYRALQSVY